MSNSSLIEYTRISPNSSNPRNHAIDTVTPHCYVGQVTVERIGETFINADRNASCNYGIGYDGKIGMYCEEKNRSRCTSSRINDNRAITIEVASDTTAPYAITEEAMESLIKLLADICKRNDMPQLIWSTSKTERVNHSNGCNMTVHRDYANKSCPGDYIYSRLGYIASEVNKILNGEVSYQYEVIGKTICESKYEANLMKEYFEKANCECTINEVQVQSEQANPYTIPTRDLKLTDPRTMGEDVKWLQWELARLDCYFMDIDGDFGKGTYKAVKLYQTRNNLKDDGWCGPNTLESLLK